MNPPEISGLPTGCLGSMCPLVSQAGRAWAEDRGQVVTRLDYFERDLARIASALENMSERLEAMNDKSDAVRGDLLTLKTERRTLIAVATAVGAVVAWLATFLWNLFR